MDPALLAEQQTVGHVLTEIWGGGGGGCAVKGGERKGGREGGTLAGGTPQMERDECCQLSRCVCSVVENTEPQVWGSWPDLIIPSALK